MTISKDIEVIVSSYGGVGTTFLINWLKKYRNTNHPDDDDGLKHLPVPPLSTNKELKCVYIYGNPELATVSLFRRDFHHMHSVKLLKLEKWRTNPISLEMKLSDYAAEGVDRFKFEKHFFNWYEDYLNCPTFFVKYDKIFDSLEPLFDFLEIPKKRISDFPKPIKRTSSLNELSEETQENLHQLYGDFNQKLARLPDYEIRIPEKTQSVLLSNLKLPYLGVWLDDKYFNLKKLIRNEVPYSMTLIQKIRDIKNQRYQNT
ncbi:hypothetical protein [Algoriphagus machipongonensis]|uniref:Sulfotransferase domain-containing protein n=1 Tax=Algoriphagus machipongonensis TaxID=388413 RepID=A3HTX7_9BACT|nr:hypothetical protein [Algoriphagus machipongonensis]EAZ81599.1 hypothetical protein ALPR1_00120 [Algoriphagus machipongonensis]